jgi:hypothetical protein
MVVGVNSLNHGRRHHRRRIPAEGWSSAFEGSLCKSLPYTPGRIAFRRIVCREDSRTSVRLVIWFSRVSVIVASRRRALDRAGPRREARWLGLARD